MNYFCEEQLLMSVLGGGSSVLVPVLTLKDTFQFFKNKIHIRLKTFSGTLIMHV